MGGLYLPFDHKSDTESKNPKTQPWLGVVSILVENTFCSSHGHSTKMITIPWQCLCMPSLDMKELLSEASYIYITPKNLSSNFGWGVVSVLSPKNLSPNFGWEDCLHLLISKWHWLQKTLIPTLDVVVYLPWWWTPSVAFRRCLCLGREHLLQLL